MGDVFYDLTGKRFKIIGFEMLRHETNGQNDITLLFENLDNVEIRGSLLTSEPARINFLFCNHPLYQNKVDEDYSEEFDICSTAFPCTLFSYEDLVAGKLSLYGSSLEGIAIYRGWMMKPELYALFYEKLKEHNIILINTPEEYKRYHLLPCWYGDFAEETAKSAWTTEPKIHEAFDLLKQFEDSVIIKDYVKSRKHEWYDACFIPHITEKSNAYNVIANFVTRQGENITGGIVIRDFVKLNSIGYHEISGMPVSEEYRAFIYAGQILIVDHYWSPNHPLSLTQDEKLWLDRQVAKINSNFATIDFARKTDGSLIIMELGDGQVSGLQQIPPDAFYRKFL